MIRTLLKPLSFIPAILLMIMIYQFSAQPAEVSSQLSYKVSYKIVEAGDFIFETHLDDWQKDEWATRIHGITRKLAHMTEYFALAVAVSFPLYVYGVHGIWLMLLAGLICVGFACGDEYHQSYVSGRSPSVRDVCIDSFGVFWGIVLVRIVGWTGRKTIFRPRKKKEKKHFFSKNQKDTVAAVPEYDKHYYMNQPTDYRQSPYMQNHYPDQAANYNQPPFNGQPGNYNQMPFHSQPGNYGQVPFHSQPDNYNQAPFHSQPGNYNQMPFHSQPGNYNQMPFHNPPGNYNQMPFHGQVEESNHHYPDDSDSFVQEINLDSDETLQKPKKASPIKKHFTVKRTPFKHAEAPLPDIHDPQDPFEDWLDDYFPEDDEHGADD